MGLPPWKKCKCGEYAKVVACKKESSKYFGKFIYTCPKDQEDQCKNNWMGVAPKEYYDKEPPTDETNTDTEPTEKESKKRKKTNTASSSSKSKKKEKPEKSQSGSDTEVNSSDSEEEKSKKKKRKLKSGVEPIYDQQDVGRMVKEMHTKLEGTSDGKDILKEIKEINEKTDVILQRLEKSLVTPETK